MPLNNEINHSHVEISLLLEMFTITYQAVWDVIMQINNCLSYCKLYIVYCIIVTDIFFYFQIYIKLAMCRKKDLTSKDIKLLRDFGNYETKIGE